MQNCDIFCKNIWKYSVFVVPLHAFSSEMARLTEFARRIKTVRISSSPIKTSLR